MHAATIHRVNCHSSRLNHRTLYVAHSLWQQSHIVIIHHGQFAHAAPGPTEADAAHFFAEVVESTATIIIIAWRDQWLYRYTVAGFHIGNSRSHVGHNGAELMAENLRIGHTRVDVRRYRRDDRACDIFMQIRAANACHQRFNQHIVGAELLGGRWHILNANILRGVKSHGLHVACLPLFSHLYRILPVAFASILIKGGLPKSSKIIILIIFKDLSAWFFGRVASTNAIRQQHVTGDGDTNPKGK